MKNLLRFLLLLLLSPLPALAQEVTVRFIPQLDGKTFNLSNGAYKSDSASITIFRFYVSNLTLTHKGRVVSREPKKYNLLDAADSNSMVLRCNVSPTSVYDGLQFTFGIDSLTNSKGAGGGALDATKGMYWAWHSGYINMKLEGSHQRSPARNQEFRFHLGGFRTNERCDQPIILSAEPGQQINIGVDVARFLNAVDLSSQHTEMTPGAANVSLAKKAANMFYSLQP